MPTHEELTQGVVNLEKRAERLEQKVAEARALALGAQSRVAELEAWNREGGVVYGLGTKLSNVEDQHEEDRTTIYGQLGEIEETLSQDRLYAVNREREEHKARWHATRDAYVAGRGHEDADADVEVWAKEFADRAHGPLEGPKVEVNERGHYVVPSGIDVNARLEQLTERDIDDHVTKEWQRRVGELVKAAKEMQENLHELGVVHHSWTSAIKPFEQEVGRG